MSPLVLPVTYAAQVKGTHVSLDDFANTPALATALNNAVVSGLLIIGPGHNGDHGSPALSDEDKKYQFPEREGRGRERTQDQSSSEVQNFMARFTEQFNIRQQVFDDQSAKRREMFSILKDQNDGVEQTLKNMNMRLGTLEQEKVVSNPQPQTFPVKLEQQVPVTTDPYI